jgi:hypothetical protein
MNGKILLTLGAWLNFGIALLHAIIIFAGAPGYAYFGATELAPLAERGSLTPAAITAALVLAFAAFGCYALSGAGRLRRLPLLKTALIIIGVIFTLRGISVVFQIIYLVRGVEFPLRYAVFSAAALIVGLLYLIGAALRWNDLKTKP